MKILFLCWRDTTHPQGGGSERYLERVGEYLVQHGHEVIYRTAAHDAAPRRQVRDGLRFSRAGGKFTVYPRAWAALLAGRLGMGPLRGIDVIVDTQNGIPFFARLFSDRPTVLLTHHCHREQWPVAGPLLSRVGWFLERRIAPGVYRSSPYVTVSEPSAGELVELGVDADSIRIIRNGIDPAPVDFARYPDTGTTHLVTLSRLVPHKQIEHAMDVVAALAPTHDVVLDVIGSGWWEQRLRDYAVSLGVADRVVLHGQVSEEHKHALLARSVLHLMPSRKEGWGLAVIEAAQHGVPTVGYRSSAGLNDSVIDGVTGTLVDDKAALIRATADLIDTPTRRIRLGTAAEKRATAFSWTLTGEQFAELLEFVAAPRG
ncbi:glycosyltransferase family 4 protein [Corynebacterium pygosceleis]|uniref:Glycosyltransferase family 4 protein n=1 Tax=Corynebacterium pygosceleis TaxID=2800406 RepID=A0A9Q4C9K5_9CORY|nr:glycosyltransferase family 4 protein [Corynebacterium pygosceleis]MCK7638277.1 glycosyltransferase family 4 protein [Corynebacterium pygosceleis]MCL0121347.1 glycosyltransferase family 4 protein [Corynebacterium pygosceleis]MCX7445639.1 glycosyltransferase family 4 protein [Corynebacterium pygosceleis]MCX7468939.1 glycosyltransferase family 4 protein [Corynebacterium pygosceleis]